MKRYALILLLATSAHAADCRQLAKEADAIASRLRSMADYNSSLVKRLDMVAACDFTRDVFMPYARDTLAKVTSWRGEQATACGGADDLEVAISTLDAAIDAGDIAVNACAKAGF